MIAEYSSAISTARQVCSKIARPPLSAIPYSAIMEDQSLSPFGPKVAGGLVPERPGEGRRTVIGCFDISGGVLCCKTRRRPYNFDQFLTFSEEAGCQAYAMVVVARPLAPPAVE